MNEHHLHGSIPTWNDYVAHPHYDEFWKRQTLIPHIRGIEPNGDGIGRGCVGQGDILQSSMPE
jgi:hypothetical protein